MRSEVVKVTGMTCSGCVASVRNALMALPGVADVAVSLSDEQVKVSFDENRLGLDAVRAALQEAGYGIAAAAVRNAPRSHGCCC